MPPGIITRDTPLGLKPCGFLGLARSEELPKPLAPCPYGEATTHYPRERGLRYLETAPRWEGIPGANAITRKVFYTRSFAGAIGMGLRPKPTTSSIVKELEQVRHFFEGGATATSALRRAEADKKRALSTVAKATCRYARNAQTYAAGFNWSGEA